MKALSNSYMNKEKRSANIIRTLKREKEFWIISLFALIWVGIFAYYPMYGLIISFYEYIPGTPFTSGEFVGLKYFIQFFQSPEFPLVMRNTLAISGLNILFGFPAPIIFALLLNEIRPRRFKRFVQTVSYLPHFISWVVVASFIFSLLGTEGLVNDILLRMGFVDRSVPFLSTGSYFWTIITVSNIWKGIGWSSIIYLSSIAGVDQELYQAGAVDGLGRFGMIWHVTIPCIMPTVVIMFILGMGGILNGGFEQQLLIGNDMTREYHEVIDTYTYRYGLQLGRYSFATAVGLMKSVVSVTLVLLTNFFSKKVTGNTVI